jgi:hypothetical protein
MAIPIRAGIDFFGHLEQDDGSTVATRCVYVNYLPIVPMGTYRLMGERAAPTSFSFKSLFAAMFKAWGFIFAGGLAAYGLAWGSWNRSSVYPATTAIALVLFLAVYASWLFLGHRERTGLRWGVVGGFAAVTLAVFAYGVMFNFDEMARRRRYAEEGLPPADIPMSVSVMKSLPDGPKPGELEQVPEGMRLETGAAVLIDLPSGTAMGRIEVTTTSETVSVTTQGGGSKVFRVSRERIYLSKSLK